MIEEVFNESPDGSDIPGANHTFNMSHLTNISVASRHKSKLDKSKVLETLNEREISSIEMESSQVLPDSLVLETARGMDSSRLLMEPQTKDRSKSTVVGRRLIQQGIPFLETP